MQEDKLYMFRRKWEKSVAEELNISGVYAIRVHANDNIGYYVGATSRSISNRWFEHRKDLIRGTHFSAGLQEAWLEHGPTAFTVVLLEAVINPANLDARERYWIEKIQPEFNVMHNPDGVGSIPSHWNPCGAMPLGKKFRDDGTNGLNYYAEMQYAKGRRNFDGFHPLF